MEALNKQTSKRNTVSKLTDDTVTGQRPSFSTMLINQAGIDTSTSTINRILMANTYLQQGKNDLAEYYLGRKLTPDEINNRVTEASNLATFDKASKIIHAPNRSTNFDAQSQTTADVQAQTINNSQAVSQPTNLNKDITVDSTNTDTPARNKAPKLPDWPPHFTATRSPPSIDRFNFPQPPDVTTLLYPQIDPANMSAISEELKESIIPVKQAIRAARKLHFADEEEQQRVAQAMEEKAPKYSSADATSNANSNDNKAAVLIDEFKETKDKKGDKAKLKAELAELGYHVNGKTLKEIKARAKAEIKSRKDAIYTVEEQKGTGLVPLGTHYYDKRKLDHLDTLSLYRSKGKGKGNKSMKDIVLSPNLVHSIKEGKPHPDLDEIEQNYYDFLANKTKMQPIRKPTPSKLTIPKSDTNRMQMQILLGEISSGNDNQQLIQQVKDLVMKMNSKHQLTATQIKKINKILELS
jgi:macrodomain Ter protein organizer (MatP/YcbG family)